MSLEKPIREILPKTYLWTRNSPLNCASHPDLDSSTRYASARDLHLELLLSLSLRPAAECDSTNLGACGNFVSCVGHYSESLEREDAQLTITDHRLQHTSIHDIDNKKKTMLKS